VLITLTIFKKIDRFKLIPILVLILSLTIFIQVQKSNEANALESATDRISIISKDANLFLINTFKAEIFSLNNLRNEWEFNEGLEYGEWEKRAAIIVEHYDLHALSWNEGTTVRWIIPVEGNEKVIGVDLMFEESRRKSMMHSIETREVSVSPPIDLVQGDKGVLLFVPVFINNKHVGFQTVVIKTEKYFSTLLSKMESLNGCNIKIRTADQIIYQKGLEGNLSKKAEFTVGNRAFELIISEEHAMSNSKELYFKIIFSVLLMILTELFIRSISLNYDERSAKLKLLHTIEQHEAKKYSKN
jgi:sensor domain CHASE-containing protein